MDKRTVAKMITDIWNGKTDLPYGIVWKDGYHWNIVLCKTVELLKEEHKSLTKKGIYSIVVKNRDDKMTIENAICTLDRKYPKDEYRYIDLAELQSDLCQFNLAVRKTDTGYKAKVIGPIRGEVPTRERAWEIITAIDSQGKYVYSNKHHILMEATVIDGKLGYRELRV